jgi:ATP-dependent DNA helicase DinG
LKISIKDWSQYFPYDEPRDIQTDVIDEVLNEFTDGKRFAVIECGTGVGKSAIGLTIANFINNSSQYPSDMTGGSYFLTTQKVLQDQYEKDFAKKGMVSLYSSSNYTCSLDKEASCKDILTGLRSNSLPKKYDSCNYKCIYKNKKRLFESEQLGITNFSYFLTEKNYSKKLPNKKVLVIDEAHNLESELTRFIEISVSEYFSEKILKLKIPKDINTQFKAFNWIKNIYYAEVKRKTDFISKQLDKFGLNSSKLEEFKKITSRYEMLTSHLAKIEQFIKIYEKDNWVFDIEKTNEKYAKFIFKPIDISAYAKDYLLQYADYVIFMSATIVSHEGFSISLGLPHEETIFIKKGSPFDPKNRPVLYCPAGSMSYRNIDNTLPKMAKMIEVIMDNHKNQKGIIHTHSNKIAYYFKNNIKSSRLLVATGENREKMLKKHLNSKQPTILISPSMTEGVDLKGNLSEFQILCKIPYPFLGDKVTKKKMNKWSWWYNTQTVRTIIQSLGRSIRNEFDTAVTYILDEDWRIIKSRSRDYFPADFFDSYQEY